MAFKSLPRRRRARALAALPLLVSCAGCADTHYPMAMVLRHPVLLWGAAFALLLLSALSACLCYAVFRRRTVEKVVRRSRDKYRTLIENTPDLILRIDKSGRHLYVGPSVSSYFGMGPDRIIGRTYSEIDMPEDVRIYSLKALNRVFATGETMESEIECDVSGGVRVFNWRVIPEKDEKGEFNTVLALFRDITEHRKAEKDYRTLFNSMLAAFCMVETVRFGDGSPGGCRFVDVNPAFERLFGVKRHDLQGTSADAFFKDVSPEWMESFLRVAQTGEPLRFENFIMGGRYFSGYAYSPSAGRFACVFNEVTEKRLAEEENRRLSGQLAQALKMEAVGRLAGGVAHDFNNLLTVILGHMELILEGPAEISPDVRESLSQVRLAARRASDLTRQLLAYGRRQTLAMKSLDLNAMIRDFSLILERLVGEGVGVSLVLDPGLGPVKADRGQLEQVLVNLSLNAKDAMPEGGKVVVETFNASADGSDPELPEGRYVCVSYSDTGHGMDEHTIGQVFEPFFTTKAMGHGKGLGLASVHGIIKQHGGAVRVESQAGGGATFMIYLPEGKEAPLQAGVQSKSLPRGTETILLVEDEQAVRAVAKRILSSLGYNVLEAENGVAALSVYGKGSDGVSLLLTDVVMPGMGGWALAGRIREINPGMRVVFMSGHSDRPELYGGNVNYLEKPFSYRDLAEIVRTVLDSPPPTGENADDISKSAG